MGGVMRLAVIPAIVLLATGCATKDWVKNLVGQKEVEIDQRVGARVGAVEGQVGQQGQKVTWIESELGTVKTTAGEARTRADAAYGRADEVNDRLSRLWNGRHKRQVVETIHVQFGFDKWDLSDGAQTVLANIVNDLKTNPNLTVDLEGYTDPVGPPAYNVGLSQRRVEAVRRYFIEQGTEMPRVHSIGLGPLNGKSTEEHAKQRRVTVRLMVNQD
jgi:outer membrane protein OmpA-like peptidoglycan-associated protein